MDGQGARVSRKPIPVQPGPTGDRTVVIAVAAAVVTALILRAWAIHYRGAVGYDETYYYILGRSIITGNGYTLNGLPHAAFPPLYPLLVGVASLFVNDISLTAGAVGAVAGALLPIPIYFVARDVHGRRAAVYAAFGAAVMPTLFCFATKRVPYVHKLFAGTEPLYFTLFCAGLAFLWFLSRRGRWAYAALAGVCFGLASLVRSEGPVVFALIFIWLVADRLAARSLFSRRALGLLAVLGAAMIVTFSPWLIYLRGVTGQWTLGPKLSSKTKIRAAMWDWLDRNKTGAFMRIHYRLSDDGSWMEEPYWGVSSWHRERLRDSSALTSGAQAVARPDMKWFSAFVRFFYSGRRALVPWFVWIFLVAGLAAPPWNSVRMHWWGFLAANVLAMAFLAMSVGAVPRNELALVALAAIPLAKGLDAAGGLVARVICRAGETAGRIGRHAPAAVMIAALTVTGVRLNIEGTRTGEADGAVSNQEREREEAAKLRAVVPAGASVMMNKPWIAVWAGVDWRVSPAAPQEEILKYALARGIEYALLEPWQLGQGGKPVELEPYLVRDTRLGEKQMLFDFSEPRGGSPDSLP